MKTECASSSGRPAHHNVHIVNLESVTKVAVLRDAVDVEPKPLSNLNFTKVALLTHISVKTVFKLSALV